jgi:predicted Zn-ribbon and HTH transcriptional regulator
MVWIIKERREIMREKKECLRCGHTWIPRFKAKPKACPKCKSYAYDKEKKGYR